MSPQEKESWLQFRERVTMQYEDALFIRKSEQIQMEQQDVVEMSRYHWENLDPDEAQSLEEYRHAWRLLGGGPRVAARLQATGDRPPPPERGSVTACAK